MESALKIFSGNGHPQLASEIAKYLKMEISELVLSKFANGELYARPVESVRGCDAFVIQSPSDNLNEDLMQLFIILDSLKRSFAKGVHVVLPFYPYSRQDRVAQAREPISAKLVADLLSAAGAQHVVTVQLHSGQTQGFFNFPVDNLSSKKLFVDYFAKKNLKDLVVVSPDAGGAKDARKIADLLNAQLAIIHKVRPRHNVAEATHVVGEVTDKTCLIFDDMIDTGGSVCAAAEALRAHGAKKDIYLAATHALFSEPAPERLRAAKFAEVVVTNSLPLSSQKRFAGLTVLSIAPLLARVIRCVHEARSVSEAYE